MSRKILAPLVAGGALALTASTTTAGATEARPVSAAQRNAAEVLLYRWWGLFERPASVDAAPMLDGLFAEDARVQLLDVDAQGRKVIEAGVRAQPRDSDRSHHVRSIEVTDLGAGKLRLLAQFVYQVREASGALRTRDGSYDDVLAVQGDGSLRIEKVTGTIGEPVDLPVFVPSYARTRAKAAIVQFQAIIDKMGPNAEEMRELVTPDVVLADVPPPPSTGKALAGEWNHEVVGANAVIAYFGMAGQAFRSISHRLESFELKPLGSNRYEATAQFDWRAETIDGQKLEKHAPRTWRLVDDGGKFMRIERLL